MSRVETPELTPKQRTSLKRWQELNKGKPADWQSDLTIIIDDVDPDVREIGAVVCAADIINSLIAAESDMWYGGVVLAAAIFKSGVTLEEIRNYQAADAAIKYHETQEVIRERIGIDEIKGAAEFMRLSGLLTKVSLEGEERYQLSPASIKYWNHFEDSYKLWRKKDPPAPAFRLTQGEA